MTGTEGYKTAQTIFDIQEPIKKTDGQPFDLQAQKGKVMLMVNTASACGFTPQLQGLETLYKEITSTHPDDFVLLGFPCNQFGGQDPGSDAEISTFCLKNYGVSFDIMAKVDVNKDTAHPLWSWMKHSKPGILGLERVKWNFEKFLIGRDGRVVGRWASTTSPATLKGPIEEALKAPRPEGPTATVSAAAAAPEPTASLAKV